MKNEKDMRLVNIYIKIHNKKTLTMDDLAYLAKYNPECFKKTCDNLIYNIPETKRLVNALEEISEPEKVPQDPVEKARNPFEISAEDKALAERIIQEFLSNLQKMESREISMVQQVDVDQVKDLVGNLYMEMMFPHSGVQGYFEMYDEEPHSGFNVRV